MTDDGLEHGRFLTYDKRKCRCALCRAANTERQKQLREARIERAKRGEGGGPEHGTYSRYNNYGCRCEPCKAANGEAGRRAQLKRLAMPKDQLKHGRRSTYTAYGCRCEECKASLRPYSGKGSPYSLYNKPANDASIDRAFNHKQNWTSKEIEIVLRDDLNTRQKADMLGRSLRAVGVMIYKCKRDADARAAATAPDTLT